VSIAPCCSVNAAFLFAEPPMLVVVSRYAPSIFVRREMPVFPLAPLMNLLEQCGLKMDVTVRSWNVALRVEPEM
jgi:hypothetical protein